MDASGNSKRILILGGGFAGAYVALELEKLLRKRRDVEVTLVSQENFVLFTPMLHEVVGGDVNITDIVQPLRKMLRRTKVLIVKVESIDLTNKRVHVRHENTDFQFEIPYDQLVLAMGAVTNFYNTPGLEEHALTMKTLGDAILLRNRAIDSMGIAENVTDDAIRRMSLTVVFTGGGFAGVESAGAINDLMKEVIRYYPTLTKDMIRVVIVHSGEIILPELSATLGKFAERKLRKRGVEILLKTRVTGYDGQEVSLSNGTKIRSRTLVWTAGITPSAVLSRLPCKLERGRVVADDCMQVPQFPGVWALGDCALIPDPYHPGAYYPPTAQHATRQAAVLAKNIVASLAGQPPRPFRFKILGLLATIGRRTGVAEILGLRFSGIIAWWMWRAIYLSKLPGLQKKTRVAIDWFFDLFFSKDIVQLPTLRSPTISEAERTTPATVVP